MGEYRVVSKREGLPPKRKIFQTERHARRYLELFGPEPWRAYPNPDAFVCCAGRECGCEGLTFRESELARRESMPALEWVRLESREVGPWAALQSEGEEGRE